MRGMVTIDTTVRHEMDVTIMKRVFGDQVGVNEILAMYVLTLS